MLKSQAMSATLTPVAAAAADSRDWRAVAAMIDHTLLRPEASAADVARVCEEAVRYGFATVFVHPAWLPLAASRLHGTNLRLGTPIGFPFGAALTSIKCSEAEAALRLGAHELDVVLNIGALKSQDTKRVEVDLRSITEIAHGDGATLKVILETPLLTVEEKILACELALNAGADILKTCTGLHGGATVEDVALLRGVAGNRAGVKASGGIRTAAQVAAMVEAGANRIGTSTSVAIVRELGAKL
jgi:deoxyribose-phosphate aldolase